MSKITLVEEVKATDTKEEPTVPQTAGSGALALIPRESKFPLPTPHPSSTVPFLKDSEFVPRGDILAQIHEKLSAPASRAALVGLGGVG